MLKRILIVASMAVAPSLSAQAPLGPKWHEVLPGKQVYTNTDSIQRIGPGEYRAVIIGVVGNMRDIWTDEIRCAQHTARSIRLRITRPAAGGRPGFHADTTMAHDPFDKAYPGGPEDIKYQNVCAIARAKFTVGSDPYGSGRRNE
jgi:hypothetical protein